MVTGEMCWLVVSIHHLWASPGGAVDAAAAVPDAAEYAEFPCHPIDYCFKSGTGVKEDAGARRMSRWR
eukprot:16126448-Heterocapsa_arctica.AAC.1